MPRCMSEIQNPPKSFLKRISLYNLFLDADRAMYDETHCVQVFREDPFIVFYQIVEKYTISDDCSFNYLGKTIPKMP